MTDLGLPRAWGLAIEHVKLSADGKPIIRSSEYRIHHRRVLSTRASVCQSATSVAGPFGAIRRRVAKGASATSPPYRRAGRWRRGAWALFGGGAAGTGAPQSGDATTRFEAER